MAAGFFLLFVALIAAAAMVGTIDQPPVRVAAKIPQPAVLTGTVQASAPERALAEDLGKHYCIGGTLCPSYCEQAARRCEAKPSYSLRLDRPAGISRIELHAEDEVGLTRVAELVVKLDGRRVAAVPVRWTGSTLDVAVNRRGQLITIEARDPRGIRFAGEEAIISDICVFGVGLK
jgi:hypothetical protein